MLIAVTGATGFVGSHVARALAECGHEVIGYGSRVWDLKTGPLRNPPNVDAVVHCAARVDDFGSPADFESINVDGTLAVLETFRSADRLVHVSTASVYDPFGPTRLVREDAAYGSRYLNEYARTKVLAERAILADGRPSIILRPHAVYGPGDTTLLPRLLAARRFGWLPIVGNGRNLVSVTHIHNLVHAIVLAVEGTCSNGIFNVADALIGRLDDILRTLLYRLGLPVRIVYVPRALASALARVLEHGGSQRPLISRYVVRQLAHEYTLDITAARAQLGYSPTFNYLNGPLDHDDTLRGMLQFPQGAPTHAARSPDQGSARRRRQPAANRNADSGRGPRQPRAAGQADRG